MKIFIAGARSVTDLSTVVQKKMFSIAQKGFEVLVGDCYGVDAAVQRFYTNLGYKNILVYASNGKARNNIGNWNIRNVPVSDSVHGFDFYKHKDIVMANDADYGFMIWDGESRGTLNNIINLVAQNKEVLICLSNQNKMIVVKDVDGLNQLINLCSEKTKVMYQKLCKSTKLTSTYDVQMSFTV